MNIQVRKDHKRKPGVSCIVEREEIHLQLPEARKPAPLRPVPWVESSSWQSWEGVSEPNRNIATVLLYELLQYALAQVVFNGDGNRDGHNSKESHLVSLRGAGKRQNCLPDIRSALH
jgi:hypothetical protein